jgi:pyridoxine kinase
VITPNVTEAALLAGMPYVDAPHDMAYIDSLFEGLAALGPKVIAITGVRPSEKESAWSCATCGPAGNTPRCALRETAFSSARGTFSPRPSRRDRPGAPVADALSAAAALVGESVELTMARGTPRRFGVAFERALPAYVERVRQIFE